MATRMALESLESRECPASLKSLQGLPLLPAMQIRPGIERLGQSASVRDAVIAKSTVNEISPALTPKTAPASPSSKLLSLPAESTSTAFASLTATEGENPTTDSTTTAASSDNSEADVGSQPTAAPSALTESFGVTVTDYADVYESFQVMIIDRVEV